MRYYVEINGESSLDIQGLMIQSLPSISKPLMRSKQETIDGRDGDIVTKLGYSAYDKTLKIGLWGNYDINEVIAFFNQEGTITFSNEPDKYYRFTILNRDDYVSQLDKFRTCTIALHCQPYKYKLNEEPEELENEYVEQEGTSLTFNNTLVAPMNIDLKGNTLQNGTPTPSSPIPINNVSGDNDIVVCGKNLLNESNISSVGISAGLRFNEYIYDASPTTDTRDWNYNSSNYFITLEAGTYTISLIFKNKITNSNGGLFRFYKTDNTFITNFSALNVDSASKTFTINETTDLGLFFKLFDGQVNIQIEKGNQPTTYEAYNGTTYNIDLPVENLIDITNMLIQGGWTDTTFVPTSTNYITLQYIRVQPSTQYTLSTNLSSSKYSTIRIIDFDSSKNIIRRNVGINLSTSNTFTTSADAYYIAICFYTSQTSSTSDLTQAQLELGTKPNTYTPYGTTPIELNQKGTNQDYFYKDSGKLYLHKEIQKVVFDGNENWQYYQNKMYLDNVITDYRTGNEIICISNYYQAQANVNASTDVEQNKITFRNSTTSKVLYIYDSRYTSADTFKTMLASNNVILYYILATPINIEITYQPLINQLNAILEAQSKEGTTNVNQVNNDEPFILDASVLSGTDSITLTNEGNTTSKPTLTITGSGVVGVYLENIQMFNISLGTNETIIIDTENMEAYYGSQLKNRQVTGDYSNFALQSGTNNLKFTGLVTNVEITNYNRWI